MKKFINLWLIKSTTRKSRQTYCSKEKALFNNFLFDNSSNIPRTGKIYRCHRISPNGLNILCQYFCFNKREKARTSASRLDSTRSLTRVTDKSHFTARTVSNRDRCRCHREGKLRNKGKRIRSSEKADAVVYDTLFHDRDRGVSIMAHKHV